MPLSLRLLVLLLIRASITSLRRHIERVTERLVTSDHSGDEECGLSSAPHSPGIPHKDTTLESMVQLHQQVTQVNYKWVNIKLHDCLYIYLKSHLNVFLSISIQLP